MFSEKTRVKNKLVIVPLQITVLQLSALLKQADSSKRKLTLTRLASAPVPFTVLSLTGNPCKEDYLAVCGLKVTVMIQGWLPRAMDPSHLLSPVLGTTFLTGCWFLNLKTIGMQKKYFYEFLLDCFLCWNNLYMFLKPEYVLDSLNTVWRQGILGKNRKH